MAVPKTASAKRQELVKSLVPESTRQKLDVDEDVESDDRASFAVAVEKLDADEARRVKLLVDLAEMADDDESMVRAIAENPNIKSLRDVALLYGGADLAALGGAPAKTRAASDSSSSTSGSKQMVTPSATEIGESSMAGHRFRKKLYLKQATGVLHRMLKDGEMFNEDNELRNSMVAFFDAHPDFDIRRESVVPLLNKETNEDSKSKSKPVPSAAVKSLKTLQRVQALTSDPSAIPMLLSAGVKSAHQVAAIPQAHFVSDMPLSPDLARDIHRHATNSVIRANMTLTTALQTVRGTGIRLIDGTSTREDRIQQAKQLVVTSPSSKSVVNLEQLFGSLDYCECSDCTSVTSPANYFAELLQYLRNNNLKPGTKPTPPTSGWAGTALEDLFRRRPDLADLELTCANTNTVLPYIDLSNEVMESFVVHLSTYINDTHHPKQADIKVFNIASDDVSAALLAQPRNVNYTAYCILKDAVYPFTLPYHQPIDETRILLGFLGTSRYELMSIFQSALQPGTPDPQDTGFAVHRAIIAEELLLTQEDYKILTLEAFYSKKYFENVLDQPSMSDATYQANIGVDQPYSYWGYSDAQANDITSADESTQLGLTFVKAQFLPRSGIDYTDLVALVQTQYVNPNWPKGWALKMLERIRFSYAYLYSLIDSSKTTKEEQLAPVITWLTKWQPIVELFEKMRQEELNKLSTSSSGGQGSKGGGGGPSACDCHCDCYCIWRCWVLRYFELFGKLVVLDSRDGAVFEAEGWLILRQPPPDPPSVIKVAVPAKPSALAGGKVPMVQQLDAGAQSTDVVIGYLARDGIISSTSSKGVTTQIGHVAGDGTLMYDIGATQVPFAKQYKLDGSNYTMPLLSIDQGTQIGYVDATTSHLDLIVYFDGDPSIRVAQWGPIQDSCNLDRVRLIHLDGNQIDVKDYGRWQRFIRLWLKLGYTIDEVDQALIGLSNLASASESSGGNGGNGSGGGGGGTPPTVPAVTWADLKDKCGSGEDSGGDDDDDCKKCCEMHTGDNFVPPKPLNITPAFLDQLAAVKQLQTVTGLDLAKLLVFWAKIGTHSGATPSLYQQLFLSTSMIWLDPIFMADANGNYLSSSTTLSAHAPAVMAALQISKSSDLAVLVSVAKITDGMLTLDNLSALFRYKILANVLGIQISRLPTFVAVFGDPFAGGAIETLKLFNEWTNVGVTGFTLMQLRYVLTGVDDNLYPVGPKTVSVLKTCKALADGLAGILTSYPDPDLSVPATSSMVTAAAGLVFDAANTAAIVGVLSGTSTWTTNAPTGLTLVIPTSLSKILQYTSSPATTTSAASAAVSSTGILTTDEATAAKALVTGSSAAAWGKAIDRLLKQPVTWFQNTLFGIFPDSKGAMDVLLAGDVPASAATAADPTDPTIPPPAPDPGTAPGKMEYFLTGFMPFLRATLEKQLVIDTMTSVSGLSSDLTALLLNNILVVSSSGGTGTTSAIATLMGLPNEPPTTPSSSWTGYLLPPSTDSYTFVAIGDTQPSVIIVNGFPVAFPHQQDDPNNIWSSDPIKLTAGTLITLFDPLGPATQLQWKTARSPAAKIPSGALLPGYATSAMSAVFVALVKTGIIINGFNLSLDEVTYLQTNGTDFGNLDFNALTMTSFDRLLAYYNLRQSLQGPASTLLDLFQWALTASMSGKVVDVSTLVSMIVASTAWDPVPVTALIDPKRFNLTSAAAYRNEIALTTLSTALGVFGKVGGGGGTSGAIDVPTLFTWAQPLAKFEACRTVAASIRKTIRGKYPLATWEQAVQPLNNQLRENQKNALIAYLVVQPILRSQGIIDADSLFEFFLIDVQMSSCLQTSRIKQAISTVQLYIQRCLLGLELDGNGNSIRVDPVRWNWMSKYRVWQANREVFLYPENWLIPSLRDDKSPFYKSLESSLMQKSVDAEAVTDAFKNYLYDVDLAANLLVQGLFLDSTGTDPILHIVSCSRHAPREYYYRNLNTSTGIWMPWEKMTVDIPSYTVEATTSGTKTETGGYVTPVVWNGRVFVFFPMFSQKTLPSSVLSDSSKSMTDMGNAKPATQAKSVQYWDIKMNVSERRDGVWTPKQMSVQGVYESLKGIDNPLATTKYVMPLINSYVFIPRSQGKGDTSTLSVDVLRYDAKTKKQVAVGRFDYLNGRLVVSTHAAAGALSIRTMDFGEDGTNNQMYSWQASSATGVPDFYQRDPLAYYPGGTSSGVVQLDWYSDQAIDEQKTNLYHSFVHQVLARLSTTNKLDDVFNYYTSPTTLPATLLSDAFGGNPQSMYHELMQPYAVYNWEVAYHAPMELVTQLLAQSQFDQALTLLRYIFNPLVNSNNPADCWQFRPFQSIIAKDYLENFFNNLQPGVANADITEWRDNAFKPYVVARSRPVAFMKAVVMLYIKTLIAYGDYYFRQNTLETVPLAIQCYVVASHIYGQPGQKIPKRGTTEAQTFRRLCDKFDAFDNAVVDLELQFPFSNQIDTAFPIGWTGKANTPVDLPNIFGSATTKYFCIPQNDQLVQLRATIDDRLFKLRHCQDINGNVQKLPLFEPPIDVALLVEATAAGLSISSVLNDLDSPMPNYRFYYLLQKAHEVVGELKTLSMNFLAAKEKGDSEALGILRQQHEIQINQLIMEVKKASLDEANASLDQLQASRVTPAYRLQYYMKLLGMDTSSVPQDASQTFSEIDNLIETPADDGGLMLIPSETTEMDSAGTAKDLNIGAGVAEGISAIFHALPTTTIHGTPLGVGGTIQWGFPFAANASAAVGRSIKIGADYLSAQSALAALRSGFLRARQDRVQQANIAGYELAATDKQILAQNIRKDIATKDIAIQQAQIDNSQEVLGYLQTKYTNTELYAWLDQQTQALCYSSYQLAYDLAKRVEKAYRFERPSDSDRTYVQYGYWDPSHNGLLAGERLSTALRQLEAAYQTERGYDYEVTKNVSLRLTQPMQLLALRQTGSCQIDLPEIFFDFDFAGHYLRRIKSVSLTLPCVTGPYTAVSCTLRLLNHTYRISPIAKSANDYPQVLDNDDNRFATTSIPISAISTSNGQNDSGLFELNFNNNERYLPFEGAGAISSWSVQLPDALRQFDYNSITDLVLTIRYTAKEGGAQLKAAAAATVATFLKSVDNLADTQGLFTLWDLKAEFATGWYRIASPLPAGSDPTTRFLALPKLNQGLPVFTAAAKKLTAVDIYLVSTTTLPVAALSVAQVTTVAGKTVVGDAITFTQGASVRKLTVYQALGADLQIGTWQLTVADDAVALDRIWLVVRYIMG